MSEEAHFSLENWLKNVLTVVFWLLLAVPLLLTNLILIGLPNLLAALGIKEMISPNEFLVALLDPTKATPSVMIPVTFVMLPRILIPALILIVVLFTVFFYEREKNVVTISKYAPIKALKETLLGLVLLLFPISPYGPGFRDFKVARFVEPTLPLWRGIWSVKEMIWPSSWLNPAKKEPGH